MQSKRNERYPCRRMVELEFAQAWISLALEQMSDGLSSNLGLPFALCLSWVVLLSNVNTVSPGEKHQDLTIAQPTTNVVRAALLGWGRASWCRRPEQSQATGGACSKGGTPVKGGTSRCGRAGHVNVEGLLVGTRAGRGLSARGRQCRRGRRMMRLLLGNLRVGTADVVRSATQSAFCQSTPINSDQTIAQGSSSR